MSGRETDRVVDLFAGPGGWSEGMAALGIRDVGLELDRDACRTRVAAGHRTVRADVAAYPPEAFAGYAGLVASPPCQAFSMAGKRAGMRDLAAIHSAVEAARSGWRDELRAGPWADDRSALILEPLRWAWAIRPTWIACEQVPPALPVWEHMADVLRSWGYAATAVKLLAADYGVPQTRTRAFLLAHREAVRVADATHAQKAAPELFDQRQPWVSMAAALGWTPGSRALDRRVGGFAADASPIGDEAPAPTITLSHGRECWRLRAGTNAHDVARPLDDPAPTLRFGGRLNNVSWVQTRPAPTVSAGGTETGGAEPFAHASRWPLPGGARITEAEAAVLQGFRPDYPFHGTKSSRFSQIGNAVPPTWAAKIIDALVLPFESVTTRAEG